MQTLCFRLAAILYSILSLARISSGFQTPINRYSSNVIFKNRYQTLPIQNALSIGGSYDARSTRDINTVLSEPVVPGPHIKLKGKVITLWGILYAISTMATAVVALPIIYLLTLLSDLFGDSRRRRVLDWVIHLWAKIAMSLVFFRPKVIGLENLPPSSEPVIYVPNHTSVLDILALSGFVPRPFKYLSKAEILKIPVIARAMLLAKHVFLRREDILDAFEVSETCVQRLRDGNSMVLFAEGTRSPNGKLQRFKKGAFQMAKTAGVRVVPVTISNLHSTGPITEIHNLYSSHSAPSSPIYQLPCLSDSAPLPVSQACNRPDPSAN